jgi:hypothetical protein
MDYLQVGDQNIIVGLNWTIKPSSKNAKEFINEKFPNPIGWGAIYSNHNDYELGTIDKPDKRTKKSLVGALIVADCFDDNVIYCKIEGDRTWIVQVQSGLISSKTDIIVRTDDLDMNISTMLSQYSSTRVVVSREMTDEDNISFPYDVVPFEELLESLNKYKKYHPKQIKSQNNATGVILFIAALLVFAGLSFYIYKEFFSTTVVPANQNFDKVYDENNPELKAEAKRRIEQAVKDSYVSNFSTPDPLSFIEVCLHTVESNDKVIAGWKVKNFTCNRTKVSLKFTKIHRSKSTFSEFHKYYNNAVFNINGKDITVDLIYVITPENRDVNDVIELPPESDLFLNYVSLFQKQKNFNHSFGWTALPLASETIQYVDPFLEEQRDATQARISVPSQYLYKYTKVVFKDTDTAYLDKLNLTDSNAVIDFTDPPFFKVGMNFIADYDIAIKYFVK